MRNSVGRSGLTAGAAIATMGAQKDRMTKAATYGRIVKLLVILPSRLTCVNVQVLRLDPDQNRSQRDADEARPTGDIAGDIYADVKLARQQGG